MMTAEDMVKMKAALEKVDATEALASEARSQLFETVSTLESIIPGVRNLYAHAGKKMGGVEIDPNNLLSLVRRTVHKAEVR